jgi:hypothetical protein
MVNSFRNWLSRWAKIGPRFGASTDSAREEHDMTEPLQPDPALKLLDRYVGTWDLHGRTLGSEVENVAGQATFEWLPGGFFLQQRVRGQVADFEVQGVEVIGYDPATGTYPSTVYPSMAGTPLAYRWEPDGDELTITTEELGRSSGAAGALTAAASRAAGARCRAARARAASPTTSPAAAPGRPGRPQGPGRGEPRLGVLGCQLGRGCRSGTRDGSSRSGGRAS